jgi:hypothetical protein
LIPFAFHSDADSIVPFSMAQDVMEIAEAVAVGVKRFQQQSHSRVFRAVADKHQRAEAHAILNVARCPAASQVSVAEIGTGKDQVGAWQVR